MAGKASTAGSLVSNKASDTPLNVQLHPLVLLTISDYITRHTLRRQSGPAVGAIIGQQSGRNFTLEHAFECKLAKDDETSMDQSFFAQRLEQYRDVHKAPALDLVGMFMLGPVDGPQVEHLQVFGQAQSVAGNDNIMLLLFQPDMVEKMEGGKLPIGLYEPFQELVGDHSETRFRELSFEVETGEAEMIGVDFVAKGGGNATAVPGGKAETSSKSRESREKRSKGKGKEKDGEDLEANGTAANVLSPEDEELIGSLTAKANAIKMMNQRINLIRSYLTSMPESYLTQVNSTALPPENTNYSLLRNINSLLSRLPLLAVPTPAQTTTSSIDPASSVSTSSLQQAASREQQDVYLTSLLAALTRSVSEAQSMANKFASVQRERGAKERGPTMVGSGMGRPTESMLDAGGP